MVNFYLFFYGICKTSGYTSIDTLQQNSNIQGASQKE